MTQNNASRPFSKSKEIPENQKKENPILPSSLKKEIVFDEFVPKDLSEKYEDYLYDA